MAQLALSLAGAAIGSTFGMPQLGFMVGSLAGSFLFPPAGQDMQGPRLDDLKVVGSSYGEPIAYGIGTARLGGKVIWCPGIVESTHEEDVGGKGGGGATMTTYSYAASFAVYLCEGPKERVLRIWADGKCIYDETGSEEVTSVEGLRWTFYPGDENQLPDPIIEADQGAGNVPAFRGVCYLVFENLQLANFGNRVPTITAEVCDEAERFFPVNRTPNLPDFIPSSTTGAQGPTFYASVDLRRNRAYMTWPVQGDSSPDAKVLELDATTLQVLRTRTIASYYQEVGFPGSSFNAVGVGGHGDYFCVLADASGGTTYPNLLIIDKNTLNVVASWAGTNGADTRWLYAWTNRQHGICKVSPHPQMALVRGSFGEANLIAVDGSYSYNWAGWPSLLGFPWGCTVYPYLDWDRPISRVVQFTTASATTLVLAIRVGRIDSSIISLDNSNGSVQFNRTTMPPPTLYQVDLATLGAAGNIASVLAWFDERDQNFFVWVDLSGNPGGNQMFLKWNESTGVIWHVFTSVTSSYTTYDDGAFGAQRVNGYLYMPQTVGSQHTFIRVDTMTGQRELIPTPNNWNFYENGFHNFTAENRDLAWVRFTGGAAGFRQSHCRVLLERRASTAGQPVAPFIERVAGRVGLNPGDMELSDIDDQVYGYYVSRVTTAKEAIQPLASVCQFDAVESDYLLKFHHRGQSPVATISYEDLEPLSDNTTLQENRTQEVELPSRVVVRYADQDRAYDVGAQQHTRPSVPARTMQANGTSTVETPVIMDATRAKRLAETTVYTAWNERSSYKFQPSPRYMWLDPTDVVELQLIDGTTYQQRLLKLTIGSELAMDAEAVGEDGATYNSGAVGDPGQIPSFPIPTVLASAMLLLDVPYLRDLDVTSDIQPVLYGALIGYGNEAWRAAAAYKRVGNQWLTQYAETDQVSYGFALTALPDVENPWTWDETSVLRVQMVSGADNISSVSELDVLNWANAIAVRSGDSWEIVQYQNAVQVDETVFDLSRLLRGRRGTEGFTSGHATGDMVVLLRLPELNIHEYPLAEVDSQQTWRAVSRGQFVEQATDYPFTPHGNSLRPYAPVDVQGTQAGGDWVLTWVRRTRYNGELRDGVGTVPLNEETESYEVDIIVGSTVVRTLSSTSPTVTYTAAQQAEDSLVGSFRVVVYQMSEAVGRGFPSEAITLNLAYQVAQLNAYVLSTPQPSEQVAQLNALVLIRPGPSQEQVGQLNALVLIRPGPSQEQVGQLNVYALVGA